jgi:hypothetical protein
MTRWITVAPSSVSPTFLQQLYIALEIDSIINCFSMFTPKASLLWCLTVFDFLQRSHGPVRHVRFSATQFQTPLFLHYPLQSYFCFQPVNTMSPTCPPSKFQLDLLFPKGARLTSCPTQSCTVANTPQQMPHMGALHTTGRRERC